jgi:hypothetical protein
MHTLFNLLETVLVRLLERQHLNFDAELGCHTQTIPVALIYTIRDIFIETIRSTIIIYDHI